MRSVQVLTAVAVALMLSQSAVAVPVLVDTFTVPASGTPVTSSVTLGAGDSYLFEAIGTFSAGANITADAEYSSGPTSYVWQDSVEGYESYGEGLLELRVDGGFVEWGAYNPSHVYILPWTGAGAPVTFDIYDIYYGNNTGELLVNIYQDVIPAPGAILLGSLGIGLVGWLRRRGAM
ncbi:MAG: hypothetical protein JW955_00075 [Sedimentisphaerales bacterium]|nr:hypothetical protein [Sedimentisphaerales bacterium]